MSMFGKKQAEIESLRAENTRLEDELTGIKPWIGLAKVIQERTAAYAADIDLEQAVNLAVQQVGEEQRQSFIHATFTNLEPEQQLEVLVQTYGDTVLKEALQQERERRQREAAEASALQAIVEEGREHHRLHFTKIPTDSKVDLFFYYESQLQYQQYKDWRRHIKGVIRGPGKLMVLEDAINETGTYHKIYEDYELVTISPAGGENSDPLYFKLKAFMPTPRRHRSGDHSMTQELGPVLIDNVDIFGVLPGGKMPGKL